MSCDFDALRREREKYTVAEERFCERCKAFVIATPMRTVMINGRSLAYWACIPGQHRLHANNQNLSFNALRMMGLFADELPALRNNVGEDDLCEVRGCNNRGTEFHHFAPKYIFGTEIYDDWPSARLCPYHHQLWHDRISGAHS